MSDRFILFSKKRVRGLARSYKRMNQKRHAVRNKDHIMQGRIDGKAASFKIYTKDLDTETDVAGIVERLYDFVLRMDAAVKKTGPLSLHVDMKKELW